MPFCDQIQPAIGIFFRNCGDLCGASNLSDPLFHSPNNPKRRILLPALTYHLFVARLKDVERQGCSRKEHHIERKKRNQSQVSSEPFYHTSSCSLTCRFMENTKRAW